MEQIAPLGQRQVDEDEEEELLSPKRIAEHSQQVAPDINASVSALQKSGGQPLSKEMRIFFEPRFGYDFSSVRIHTNAQAANAAQAVNARAFTVGKDVAFGADQYAPGTTDGKKLLAHELGHVVQQTGENGGESKVQSIASEQKIQRWSISGNRAVSDRRGDTLWGLAKNKTGSGFNWPCIRPVSMKSPKAKGTKYPYYVIKGDEFDISNLTARTGPALSLHLFSPGKNAGLASSWYGAVASLGVDNDIEGTSNFGKTPIQTFLIFSHSGGNSMWGGASTFTPGSHSPKDPAPTFEFAELSMFPRRCWFTRNARARSVGCNSNAVGKDFAKTYLRKGANIITTTRSVRPRCQGLPFRLGSLFGIPGGCLWYNGVDFATSPNIGATTLEGPFWSVAAFHAGSFWETVDGKL